MQQSQLWLRRRHEREADGGTEKRALTSITSLEQSPTKRPSRTRAAALRSCAGSMARTARPWRKSYFGPDGPPMQDKHRSVAVVRGQYDDASNTIEKRHFGTDLQPAADSRHGAANRNEPRPLAVRRPYEAQSQTS